MLILFCFMRFQKKFVLPFEDQLENLTEFHVLKSKLLIYLKAVLIVLFLCTKEEILAQKDEEALNKS